MEKDGGDCTFDPIAKVKGNYDGDGCEEAEDCTPTATVPSDGIDNDCDGLIDEEIDNLFDDDDGLINEDQDPESI